MNDENTGERRSLSLDQAAAAMKQLRNQAEQPEKAEDEPETEAEELADEADGEELREEEFSEDDAPEEDESEQADAEDEEEFEPEVDEEGDLYEVEGEQFTLAELKEWKANGLRQSDYTKKTQELSQARKDMEQQRVSFDEERQKVAEHLQKQEAQLKDALATFAIEQAPKPKRSDFRTTDEFLIAQDNWSDGQEKKQKAAEAYQALQSQQHQQVVQRETEALLRHFPEWRNPEEFAKASEDFLKIGKDYDFSAEEMQSFVDHRYFRLLNDLKQLRAATDTRKAKEGAASKKVVKAAKRLPPGAKPNSDNQESKALRQKRGKFKKTGTVQDALEVLRAKRRAG